ncbi:MAG: AI-2E family transporter [Oscillospiraceae bacterium]|nr:AI-2E family transporter [Oscillospiraceae bacterium]
MFKFEWNKKYFVAGVYAFGVCAAAILFFFGVGMATTKLMLLDNVLTVLRPIINGLLFSYMINPLLAGIESLIASFLAFLRKRGLKKVNLSAKALRRLGVFFSWLFLFFLFVFLLAVLIPCINANLNKVGANLGRLTDMVASRTGNVEDLLHIERGTLVLQTRDYLAGLQSHITVGFESFLPRLFGYVRQLTAGFVSLFMTCVVSIYFSLSKEVFGAQLKKFLSVFLKEEQLSKMIDVVRELNAVFNSFMFGKLLLAAVVGLLCFGGMAVLGMPYAVFISATVGIATMVPYFGPLIAAMVCFVILLLESPMKAFVFLGFLILLQQFEGNVLAPKILGDKTGLGGFWVVFAIVFFGGLFGVIGMILGVPVFAMCYLLLKRLVEAKLAQKGKPTETSAYLQVPQYGGVDTATSRDDDAPQG